MTHPYYIFAFDYRDNSSGIVYLHRLCDMLNREGLQAWVFYCEVTKKNWHTPILTQETIIQHRSEGKAAIAVYPETIVDDLLRTPVVVRWMLNKEGTLTGGKRIKAGADDLFFYCHEGFVPDPEKSYDYLAFPFVDTDIFSPDPASVRSHPLLYINRIPESAVDLSRFPPDIEILSNECPVPLEQLATKLKRATVIYTYEYSTTIKLAMLCGCPVVSLRHPKHEELAYNPAIMAPFPKDVFAFSDAPEEIEKSRRNLWGMKEFAQALEDKSKPQLKVFIEKTQAAARSKAGTPEAVPIRQGIQAFHAGNYTAAIEHLSGAMAGEPENPLPPAYLAFTSVRQGRVPEARDFIALCEKIAPERHDLMAAFSEMLQEAGHLELAVDCLQRAVSACPHLLDAFPALGRMILSDNRLRYARWMQKRQQGEPQACDYRERVRTLWKTRPLFEIFVFLRAGGEALLADTIDSLAAQYYDGWRLSVFASRPSPEPEFTRDGNVVRWIEVAGNTTLIEAANARLHASQADWVGFVECGMQFSSNFLLSCGDYIAIHPGWRLIYTDEDTFDTDGRLKSPLFKPDFNLELLRSADYIGSLLVDRNMLLATGGYTKIPDAAYFDIALRIADACGDSAIGHIPDTLVHVPQGIGTRAAEGGAAQALREHLARRGIAGEVFQGLVEGVTRRIVYQHPDTPKVSIVVTTKNRLDLIRPCVESLFQKTRYPEWELLLVDNGSDDPEVIAWYMEIRARHPGRIRLMSFDAPFNYSAMNNRASLEARGEYLLLLNNDTECIHDDWLDAMMAHAQRPDVGIVGARLLFPDSLKVQHAGIVLGIKDTADHVHTGSLAHDEPGYLNRALADQEYSAVTGACLLIRKSLFDEVGGLDEDVFQVLFNDVDLCLKVRKRGLRIVWTPFATLLYHALVTLKQCAGDPKRGEQSRKENSDFYLRWRRDLANDPAWNRNLSLSATDPSIEDELAVPWQREFHDRPRVVAMASTSHAIEEYRYLGPLRALHAENRLFYVSVCRPSRNSPDRAPSLTELDRMDPDVLLMHSALDNVRCAALLRYRAYRPDLFRIFSVDDLMTDLPLAHPGYDKLPAEMAKERTKLALKASHRLIVSTEPLAEAYRHLIDDIRVIPNALDSKRWEGLVSRRRQGKKLRVGWAGAEQHGGDLILLQGVLEATHTEVDWIFLGSYPNELKPFVAESHAYVHFSKYPEKLASLDLDLGVVPLDMNPFNEAKSNLRLLEYGILGWPVICTDIYPYRTNDPPVTRLPNDTARWIAAIRERVADPDALAREGDALRAWVKRHYLLENHLDQWRRALLP